MKSIASIFGSALGVFCGGFIVRLIGAAIVKYALSILISLGVAIPVIGFWQVFMLLWALKIIGSALFYKSTDINFKAENS